MIAPAPNAMTSPTTRSPGCSRSANSTPMSSEQEPRKAQSAASSTRAHPSPETLAGETSA